VNNKIVFLCLLHLVFPIHFGAIIHEVQTEILDFKKSFFSLIGQLIDGAKQKATTTSFAGIEMEKTIQMFIILFQGD
jgi:hypothetical protein